MGASIASVYDAPLRLRDTLLLTISQSGRSPDILTMQRKAKHCGVATISITNDVTSPLAAESDYCLPLHAGEEHSIAVTKTFLASAALAAALVSAVSGDQEMESALHSLPEALAASLALRNERLEEALTTARSAFAIGRGPSMPIACEAALKLKETCGIHAEAYSAAEVPHGPMEVIGQSLPVLVFGSYGAAGLRIEETATRRRAQA